MSTQKTIAPEFEINIKTVYIPQQSCPEKNFHFFAYRISIKNTGSVTAQLVSRHWIITDANGHHEEVRGPGVVGQQPSIAPGQVFEYESSCPLPTASGSMKGRYQMITDNGEDFTVVIPEFYLIAPHSIH